MYVSAPFQSTAETNRVLRSTFLLTALSLIPTVFGTYLGIALGLPAFMAASPWMSLGVFLVMAIGLIMGIHATSKSAAGLVVLGIFTMFMGAILSGIVSVALGVANGQGLIATAFAGTAAVMVGCSAYAMTTKRDFSGWGGGLIGMLLAVVVVGLLNVFFQLSWLSLLLAVASLALFSVFMIYDVQKIVNGGETNYIVATLSVYLNMVNIFSSLLQILLSLFGSNDD